jgi:hypothetical protein
MRQLAFNTFANLRCSARGHVACVTAVFMRLR